MPDRLSEVVNAILVFNLFLTQLLLFFWIIIQSGRDILFKKTFLVREPFTTSFTKMGILRWAAAAIAIYAVYSAVIVAGGESVQLPSSHPFSFLSFSFSFPFLFFSF